MYDAIVIGSGPAGYECARKIGEMGGKAIVVERDKLGGTCTNYGCIPTKALHASASFFSDVKNSSNYGFTVPPASAYFNAIMERKDKVASIMCKGIKKLLGDSNVAVINGEGKIKDNNTVLVGEKELKAKNIVIATGAHPKLPNGVRTNEFILTSNEILKLKELPPRLIIIGGGYIGSEFASIFASLGIKVTILEMLPRIVSSED